MCRVLLQLSCIACKVQCVLRTGCVQESTCLYRDRVESVMLDELLGDLCSLSVEVGSTVATQHNTSLRFNCAAISAGNIWGIACRATTSAACDMADRRQTVSTAVLKRVARDCNCWAKVVRAREEKRILLRKQELQQEQRRAAFVDITPVCKRHACMQILQRLNYSAQRLNLLPSSSLKF